MSFVHPANSLNLRRDVRNAVALTSASKSTRRPPHKTTEAQKQILMAEFDEDPNPSAMKRDRLARVLNIERRIVKNWFSNQRALRRKTGQGYRGWMSGSVSSHSAYGSGDELETYPTPASDNPAKSSKRRVLLTRNDTPTSPLISPEPQSPPPLQNILSATINADPLRTILPKSAAPAPYRYTRAMRPPPTIALPPPPNAPSSRNLISPPVSLPLAYPSSWLPSPIISPARLLHQTISNNHNNSATQDIPDELEEDKFSPSLMRGYPESALRSSLAV
ncbi:hypothetical protein BU17DRAFT_70787 [Hysterangium stoloniferum]|nr:hypothetical protein BU17DRAFT_70787 [Hysterangium stoloniferum]